MINRLKIFTESVSQMDIGPAEVSALTKLFKVCLESALMLDDEENKEYDTDTSGYDFSEDDYYTGNKNERPSKYDSEYDDVDEPDTRLSGELRDELKTDRSIWRDDDFGLNTPPEQTENIDYESNVGTSLVNAYIKFAPKLLDKNLCTAEDVDNMGKFIDWLIKKFNSIDASKYMQRFVNMYSPDNKSRSKTKKILGDGGELDKALDFFSKGQPVITLLKEIKKDLGDKLSKASLSSDSNIFSGAKDDPDNAIEGLNERPNDSSIFSVAKDINRYVTQKFNSVDGARDIYTVNEFAEDDTGFDNSTELDAYLPPAEDNVPMAADTNTMSNYTETNAQKNTESETDSDTDAQKNTESETDSDKRFPVDTDPKDVDDAITSFINFVPTVDIPEAELNTFINEVDNNKRSKAKSIADKRVSLTHEHHGDVANASTLKRGSRIFAGLKRR